MTETFLKFAMDGTTVWSIECPELSNEIALGKMKERNNPNELKLVFVGKDGSEWIAKWRKRKK